jgi:signal transduction histidine kinase
MRITGPWRRVRRFLLSVPTFVKVVGIGVMVAAIFGLATLYQVQTSLTRALYRELEQNLRASGHLLAESVARPVALDQRIELDRLLSAFRTLAPDAVLIRVENATKERLAASVADGVAPDLADQLARDVGGRELTVVRDGDTAYLVLALPLLEGKGGRLTLAFSDARIRARLRELTLALLATLLACFVIGILLAVVLTTIFVRPLTHLTETADAIRAGDLTRRATITAEDEIGLLGTRFNEMADALVERENQLVRKERERQRLIDRLVDSQEAERRLLARELHDEVGPSLSSVLLMLDALAAAVPDAAKRRIAETAAAVRGVIESVRNLSFTLRPSLLDDYGLDSALRRYLERLGEHAPMTIDYRFVAAPDAARLSEAIETTLYRIVQEAVNNVLKHAAARCVSVVIYVNPDECRALIEDDGAGFDPASEAVTRRGVGLIGMRERAELVGGSLAVEAVAGEGTTLSIRIPRIRAAA